MNKKFAEKFTAVVSAVCMISAAFTLAIPTEIIHTAETTAVNFSANFLFIKSPVYNVKMCVCFRIIICLFFFMIKDLNLNKFRFACKERNL